MYHLICVCFKQKTAYEMRISDWSSDVCSSDRDDAVARHDWDYIYEPDAQAVLEHVLTRYIESLVYQAVMENVASEHAARMVVMKAASDNANKLIRSEERSVGKECVSTCRSWWSQYH